MKSVFVKSLKPSKKGQILELYKTDSSDHPYLVVSTINLDNNFNEAVKTFREISHALTGKGALLGIETMAFSSDKKGKINDYMDIFSAAGPNSRREVLEQMGAPIPLNWKEKDESTTG